MVIVALASPPLGAIADHAGVRKRFLALLTYLSVGATALMATVSAGRRRVGPRARRRRDGGVRGRHRLLQRVPARPGRRDRGGAGSPRTGSPRATRARRSPWPPRCPSRSRGSYGGAFLTAAALFGLFSAPRHALPPARPSRRSVRSGRPSASASRRRARTSGGSCASPSSAGSSSPTSSSRTATNTVVYFSAVFAGHTLGFTTAEVIGLYFVVQISALAGAWLWARPIDTLGAEDRRDDDPRPVVPGRRGGVLRHDQGPVLRGGGLRGNRARRRSRPRPAPSWRA